MIRDENTGLEVIDVHPLKSKILLVAKLLSGEVHTNMILESKETGNLFQVIGISFIPADAFTQAKRALTLKPIHHQEKLTNFRLTIDDFRLKEPASKLTSTVLKVIL